MWVFQFSYSPSRSFHDSEYIELLYKFQDHLGNFIEEATGNFDRYCDESIVNLGNIDILKCFVFQYLNLPSHFCLSIHQLLDICVFFILGLLWIMLLWIIISSFVFEHLFLIILSVYLGGELLGHMVIYLNFYSTIKMFLTVTASFCISNSYLWGFLFLYTLINTYFVSFKDFSRFAEI